MKLSPRVRHILLISTVSVLVALVWITAAAAAVAVVYQNRVEPHTVVAGVNLGSKSVTQATQLLQDQSAKLATTPMIFQLNEAVQTLTPNDLGVTLNFLPVTIPSVSPGSHWLSPVFWYDFFRPKTVAPTYSFNDAELAQEIEQKFSVNTNPQNATIITQNGNLVVRAAQPGIIVNIAQLKTSLSAVFLTGNNQKITVPATTLSTPSISTEQATAVVQTITQAIHPITLQGGGKQFTVSVIDQYSLIAYSTNNNQLTWQLDKTKVQAYLQNKIANALNIRMISQITENGTGNVVTPGKDGQSVNIATLLPIVYQALTAPAANATPITIPISTIPFTQLTVDPGYVANLFPNVYVDVNLSKQRMYIMNGANVTAEYLISSGQASLPTPVGQFYICNKIPEPRSTLYNNLWMPDWNALSTSPNSCAGYVGYGVHALPCFDQACKYVEDANHLGIPISHGCIRLSDANAVWFYQNIPIGTPVNIHT
jgi:lipoprotein-anchoring transpeptidase ErfK/SrfK